MLAAYICMIRLLINKRNPLIVSSELIKLCSATNALPEQIYRNLKDISWRHSKVFDRRHL